MISYVCYCMCSFSMFPVLLSRCGVLRRTESARFSAKLMYLDSPVVQVAKSDCFLLHEANLHMCNSQGLLKGRRPKPREECFLYSLVGLTFWLKSMRPQLLSCLENYHCREALLSSASSRQLPCQGILMKTFKLGRRSCNVSQSQLKRIEQENLWE